MTSNPAPPLTTPPRVAVAKSRRENIEITLFMCHFRWNQTQNTDQYRSKVLSQSHERVRKGLVLCLQLMDRKGNLKGKESNPCSFVQEWHLENAKQLLQSKPRSRSEGVHKSSSFWPQTGSDCCFKHLTVHNSRPRSKG